MKIKSASTVTLKQLDLPLPRGGHLVVEGGHPESLQTLPRCWAREILSPQFPTLRSKQASYGAGPPVEMSGGGSASWQRKETDTANKPAEKREMGAEQEHIDQSRSKVKALCQPR